MKKTIFLGLVLFFSLFVNQSSAAQEREDIAIFAFGSNGKCLLDLDQTDFYFVKISKPKEKVTLEQIKLLARKINKKLDQNDILAIQYAPFLNEGFWGDIYVKDQPNNKSFFKDKDTELKVFSRKRLANYFQNRTLNNEPKEELINCDSVYAGGQDGRKRYKIKRFRMMKKSFDDFESNVINLPEEPPSAGAIIAVTGVVAVAVLLGFYVYQRKNKSNRGNKKGII